MKERVVLILIALGLFIGVFIDIIPMQLTWLLIALLAMPTVALAMIRRN